MHVAVRIACVQGAVVALCRGWEGEANHWCRSERLHNPTHDPTVVIVLVANHWCRSERLHNPTHDPTVVIVLIASQGGGERKKEVVMHVGEPGLILKMKKYPGVVK